MTTQQEGKCYDPNDTTLKFVNRRDDLDPLGDDDGTLRAEMSCGHAVTPESLTGWCRSLLDQGQYKFLCPALKEGTLKKCGAQWTYQEVRRLAVLTTEEMEHFEETLACLAAATYCEFKACPSCQTCLERKDISNLNVCCTICTADKQKTYEFCWQCLKKWKGSGPRSDRCDNEGCTNHDLELLKNCKSTSLNQVQGVTNCPSIRACPTCGQKVEHDKLGCKNIICPRCQVEFCFVCIKLTPECLKTSSYFIPCSDGVAPRQTTIPVWQRR
ncbi:probable E3 ubiquitin-protein ligase ARI5 [Hypomesus transpacificus]|uniref:probable E3 ubiquitin-protein ligase ARI5 n=1 Tax=Hypomesus transpacificus TaxID=137520 RepID=UPI001F07F7E2|nr:probable E3 ubiquitin-protein ligase ARI5 [Hypomesus transpacificus]